MKKTFLYLLFFALGCNHGIGEKKDIKPDICVAVKKYFSSLDATKAFTIDTIIVMRIDTLTPLSEARFRVNQLLGQVDGLRQRADYLKSMFELKSQKAILHASLFGKGDTMTKMSKGDAEKARAEISENLETMTRVLNQADSINMLIEGNRLDSVTFLGYLPLVKISAVNNASGVVSSDSLVIGLDKSFYVLEYKDVKN